MDDVPDYNEAFPQLRSARSVDGKVLNSIFSSTHLSANGNSSNGIMGSTTTSVYSANTADEDRQRKLALHASSVTTKIVSQCIVEKNKRMK